MQKLDDIDAITAAVAGAPTMFARTITSTTKDGRPPHSVGWTDNPEDVDKDQAKEDPFAFVDLDECDSDSSPTSTQTHPGVEAEQDEDIFKDPYFTHGSEAGQDPDDILKTSRLF
jgi:hypothetical protein